MLIYSEERYVPTDINMMVIKGKDDKGYFYIHRMLYDQAVVLNDIYGDNPVNLIRAITNKEESREDVDYFLEHAPTPINIFGPYLLLIKDKVEEFVDMVGAIHVMSMPVNLRAMVKVPYEMRTNVFQFSLSIREEYQLAWDRWFILNKPYDAIPQAAYSNTTPMSGTAITDREEVSAIMDTAAESASSGKLADPNKEEWNMDDVMAFLNDENFDFDSVELDDEEDSSTATAAPEPTPAPEPEPEPEPAPAPLSGVDALINL